MDALPVSPFDGSAEQCYPSTVDPDSPLATLLAPPLGWAMAAVWGALWGSFCNVAIYRLGAAAVADQSPTWLSAARPGLASLGRLVRPPSRCPSCGTPIRWYDNVPIFGWLLLGGKCRSCRARIAVRYPLIEAAAAGLGVAVYARFVLDVPQPPLLALARFFVYFAFCGVLLCLVVIDLETMFLPLAITLPSLVGFFLAGRVLGDVALGDALLGAALGFGIFFSIRVFWKLVFKRDGMGDGDELLVATIGGLLGWRSLAFTLFVGATLGTLTVLPILVVRRLRAPPASDDQPRVFGVEVPFGPFLAIAGGLYLFFGSWLWARATAYFVGE